MQYAHDGDWTQEQADATQRRPSLADRRLDVGELLNTPDEPVPWRCQRLAADGYVTILTGEGGEGKSLLTLALAKAVADGSSVAGISCTRGRALMFDGENGKRLLAQRVKAAGLQPTGVAIYNADGFDILRDAQQFEAVIRAERANLVVLDSLRILAPTARESEADHMAPLMTIIRQLARNTEAACIVVHHRPKGENASDFRGSSVIRDQADMLFVLGRERGDAEVATRRSLRTSKCRIDAEPDTRWMSLSTDGVTGSLTIEEAEPFNGHGSSTRQTGKHDLAAQLRPHLSLQPRRRAELARAVGRSENDGQVGRALQLLADDGCAEQTSQGWRLSSQPSTPKEPGWLAGAPTERPPAASPHLTLVSTDPA